MTTRFSGERARPDFVPIRGWEHVALVGLVVAVQDLADLVEDVREYALDAVEAVEAKFQRWGGADPHGLTLDEAAALSLYTKQNVGKPDQSFYAVLNRRCWEMDRTKIVVILSKSVAV